MGAHVATGQLVSQANKGFAAHGRIGYLLRLV